MLSKFKIFLKRVKAYLKLYEFNNNNNNRFSVGPNEFEMKMTT